jgi:hypothetical protein
MWDFQKLLETDRKAKENLKWFLANHPTLLQKYDRNFVAVEGGEVIEYGKDIETFFKRLRINPKYTDATLVQFVSSACNDIGIIENDIPLESPKKE